MEPLDTIYDPTGGAPTVRVTVYDVQGLPPPTELTPPALLPVALIPDPMDTGSALPAASDNIYSYTLR